MYHIGEQHMVRTVGGEDVCVFHGQVPRVGEVIICATDRPESRRWRVEEVRWLVGRWLKEPLRRDKGEVDLSQALVLVREVV